MQSPDDEEKAAAPFQQLEFYIGGYAADHHQLKLKNNRLRHECSPGRLYGVWENIDPSEIQWLNFRKVLNDIGVWTWKKAYANELGVMDGTQWELKIKSGNHSLETWGDNHFPGKPLKSDPMDEGNLKTSEFEMFLRAVGKLTGKEW